MLYVYCEVNKGGWTRIMNKVDRSIYFNKSLIEYKNGFGDIEGNNWLGLDHMRFILTNRNYKIRFELFNDINNIYYFEFNTFMIGSESEGYKITLSDLNSRNINPFINYMNGMKFSTYDSDNDKYEAGNCALNYKTGWWMSSCYKFCLICESNDAHFYDSSGSFNIFANNTKMLIKPNLKK